MRLLFTSTAGLGHLLPLIQLADGCLAAGHEVGFATPLKDPPAVLALDVPHHQFDGPDAERESVPEEIDAEPATVNFGWRKPSAALPGLRLIVDSFGPDAIISEGAEFAGGMIAESAAIPFIRMHPGIVGGGRWERLVAPVLSRLRLRHGLEADPEARWLLDAPQISYFPAAFELSGATPEICRVRRPGRTKAAAPRTDTIYITFGTEIVNLPFFAALVRDAVAAATTTGLDVVLSIHQADPEVFSDLSGIRIERWVDQDAFLPTVRAIICHAGAGTTLGAISAGTPIVAVPFFADQPYNAELITASHTGLAVAPGPKLAERIGTALGQVLENQPAGCASMAQAVRDLPDIHHAVDMIASSVRRGS